MNDLFVLQGDCADTFVLQWDCADTLAPFLIPHCDQINDTVGAVNCCLDHEQRKYSAVVGVGSAFASDVQPPAS